MTATWNLHFVIISESNAAIDLILVSKCMFLGGKESNGTNFNLVVSIHSRLLYNCIWKLSRQMLDSTQNFEKNDFIKAC